MIIGIPTSNNAQLQIGFVKSLIRIKKDSIFQEGCNIAINRNKIFETARILGENLLFIDSDMVFTPEDVACMEKHLETNDIVTGVCVTGFPDYPPAIFKIENGSYVLTKPTDEVDGCGGAFLGISTRVLNRMIEPFTPIEDKKTGQFYGEDISFCIRAREQGFKIICDPKLLIGHIRSKVIYYADK